MDENVNVQISGSPLSSELPFASLPLPISSRNISPLETPNEAAVGFSSTSSPKIAIYNSNPVGNDQQRCSPSVSNPSIKRALSRSGTPSSSNALHLKIGTPKSTAGDVYEFHSSPEEDNVPSTGSAFFFASLPNTGGVLQSKMMESHQPPQKRIKTAILAKKLLAAAADSNLIEPIGVGQPQNGNGKKTTADEHFGNESAAIFEEEQKETEGIGYGLFEEDEDEAEEQEDERELEEQKGQEEGAQADATTSVIVQEQKKVPPLRISLLKTPSEEGADASAQISPPLRRNRGGSRVGGRKQVYCSKKEDLQRITRSRVRQIETNANAALLGRKRRFRSALAGSSENNGLLEEEEDAMSGIAENGGEAENTADDEQRNSNNEDQRSEEDSRHSATGGNRTADGGDASQQQQRQSLAASVLSKNSLEQSATFEAMLRERWALQYKEYLSKVTERMESTNLNSQDQCQEVVAERNFGSDVTKEWPEILRKLYSEQSNRSREMAEAHRLDRERIRTMMQREKAKMCERKGKTTDEGQSHFITAVSILRDSECYDPTVFAESTSNVKKFQTPSLDQLQQKFNYLVNITKNRHIMEAHTLGENHKAEWNRALRKIARENERQQMLKGTTSGKQRLIHLPLECCSESVVPVVKLVDIPLVSFQNEG